MTLSSPNNQNSVAAEYNNGSNDQKQNQSYANNGGGDNKDQEEAEKQYVPGYAWFCEYCQESFATFQEAVDHEETCDIRLGTEQTRMEWEQQAKQISEATAPRNPDNGSVLTPHQAHMRLLKQHHVMEWCHACLQNRINEHFLRSKMLCDEGEEEGKHLDDPVIQKIRQAMWDALGDMRVEAREYETRRRHWYLALIYSQKSQSSKERNDETLSTQAGNAYFESKSKDFLDFQGKVQRTLLTADKLLNSEKPAAHGKDGSSVEINPRSRLVKAMWAKNKRAEAKQSNLGDLNEETEAKQSNLGDLKEETEHWKPAAKTTCSDTNGRPSNMKGSDLTVPTSAKPDTVPSFCNKKLPARLSAVLGQLVSKANDQGLSGETTTDKDGLTAAKTTTAATNGPNTKCDSVTTKEIGAFASATEGTANAERTVSLVQTDPKMVETGESRATSSAATLCPATTNRRSSTSINDLPTQTAEKSDECSSIGRNAVSNGDRLKLPQLQALDIETIGESRNSSTKDPSPSNPKETSSTPTDDYVTTENAATDSKYQEGTGNKTQNLEIHQNKSSKTLSPTLPNADPVDDMGAGSFQKKSTSGRPISMEITRVEVDQLKKPDEPNNSVLVSKKDAAITPVHEKEPSSNSKGDITAQTRQTFENEDTKNEGHRRKNPTSQETNDSTSTKPRTANEAVERLRKSARLNGSDATCFDRLEGTGVSASAETCSQLESHEPPKCDEEGKAESVVYGPEDIPISKQTVLRDTPGCQAFLRFCQEAACEFGTVDNLHDAYPEYPEALSFKEIVEKRMGRKCRFLHCVGKNKDGELVWKVVSDERLIARFVWDNINRQRRLNPEGRMKASSTKSNKKRSVDESSERNTKKLRPSSSTCTRADKDAEEHSSNDTQKTSSRLDDEKDEKIDLGSSKQRKRLKPAWYKPPSSITNDNNDKVNKVQSTKRRKTKPQPLSLTSTEIRDNDVPVGEGMDRQLSSSGYKAFALVCSDIAEKYGTLEVFRIRCKKHKKSWLTVLQTRLGKRRFVGWNQGNYYIITDPEKIFDIVQRKVNSSLQA